MLSARRFGAALRAEPATHSSARRMIVTSSRFGSVASLRQHLWQHEKRTVFHRGSAWQQDSGRGVWTIAAEANAAPRFNVTIEGPGHVTRNGVSFQLNLNGVWRMVQ